MTPERFGELTASIAWALINDATAVEIAYLEQKWDEVGKLLPIALATARGAKTAGDALSKAAVERARRQSSTRNSID